MRFARELADKVSPGDVLCLQGDLGMGKSVLARGLIRALSGTPALEVPSPTFTLVQTYETPGGDIWHFDLYRLKRPEEVFELGWDDALSGGISIIEWPERLGGLIPPVRTDIHLQQNPDGSRLLRVESRGNGKFQ